MYMQVICIHKLFTQTHTHIYKIDICKHKLHTYTHTCTLITSHVQCMLEGENEKKYYIV